MSWSFFKKNWKKSQNQDEVTASSCLMLATALYIPNCKISLAFYFGGARSTGFATLRNVSKLTFFDKIGHVKSVGFRFYSAIWRSESRISSRFLEITSISLIYSSKFSRKKKNYFGYPAVRYHKFKWEFVIIGRACLVLLKFKSSLCWRMLCFKAL